MENSFAGSILRFDLIARRILVLGEFIFADGLTVSVIIVVPEAKHELLPRSFASIAAVELWHFRHAMNRQSVTAKDELPAVILTDFTVPWIISGSLLPIEVVVVAADLHGCPCLWQHGLTVEPRRSLRSHSSSISFRSDSRTRRRSDKCSDY